MNNQANSSDFPKTGVPASSLGMILQRGGEELILEQVLDRFTVRPSTEFTSNNYLRLLGHLAKSYSPSRFRSFYSCT